MTFYLKNVGATYQEGYKFNLSWVIRKHCGGLY
jgi:hypothetical protein